MLHQLCPFLICVWILLRAVVAFNMGGDWTYYFEELDTETSDESKMSFDMRYDRVGPGIYALSGTVDIKYDFGEDTYAEALVYRSASGNSDYKVLPYSMPKQHYVSAMNSFYKKLLMKDLAECSNLPIFEDKFVPPFEKKLYKLDKCLISTDDMPKHMPEGFYKIVLSGTGEVEWKIIVVIKLEPVL